MSDFLARIILLGDLMKRFYMTIAIFLVGLLVTLSSLFFTNVFAMCAVMIVGVFIMGCCIRELKKEQQSRHDDLESCLNTLSESQRNIYKILVSKKSF